MTAAIECRSVFSEIHGRELFKGLNLVLERGKKHALVGANGSGKTALLNVICGLLPITGGEIWLEGRRVDRLSVRERVLSCALARSFQTPQLLRHLSVAENIALAYARRASVLSALGLRAPDHHDSLYGLKEELKDLGIRPATWSHPVETLSHGNQRLVDLARALAAPSRVLLLDEPFSNLHRDLCARVCEHLDRRMESGACTILVISHEPDIIEGWADNIVEASALLGRRSSSRETRTPC
jgi:ABC-type branched-subunit amino acid transport system ATPase component